MKQMITKSNIITTIVYEIAHDPKRHIRLAAIWDLLDTPYIALQQKVDDAWVTQKKYADLDEAIAAYNEI